VSRSANAIPPIALVDDEEETTALLKEFLEHQGVEVECFQSAEKMLSAEPARFGAIVLDIHLPGMWGSECGAELRNFGYKGPLIAVTGNIEDWDPDDLRDLGFDHTLPKPFDPHDLLECVRKYVLV
jgi:DNA-binding response OmpR family regulator